ncbi:MAG TPA: SpoIIE family protein phosphatase [Ramlibacter sp.]|uniref:PP2C family protein-serine/threonine phosphatase n=1 Tax=Ramlibacter sp. TaxID=1917967 RepID=UPI002ED597E2
MTALPSESPPIRALVVDDDPIIVQLLCAFLRSRGYEAEDCADGQEALERVRDGGINLVLTDRHMPRMDGLALCRAIRALRSDAYIYCIMLTTAREESSLVAAMEAGVDDFVPKPIRLQELGARLRAAERVLGLEAGLASRNRDLAEAYEQLSRELELARVLQLGQLPPAGNFGRIGFDWVFEASGYVGGDIFDYFELPGGCVGFFLADVSGHGVAAAMMAFHVQQQLRAVSQYVAPPVLQAQGLGAAAVAAVTEYNRRFLQMKETSLYLTLLYGLIDPAAGQLAVVQAGHPPALHAARAQDELVPVGDGGLPVGILPEPGYEAVVLPFGAGARLALYSDGITDCQDTAGQEFGIDRLRQLLQRHRDETLNEAGRRLHAALRAWHGDGPFHDDVTFLAVEGR